MSAAPAKVNPFPGLRSFTQEEDYLFFGREEQTLELLQRLGSNRFVAVVGTSGSGKSSLVRCGLLSELLGGRMLGAGASWEIAVTHPGGNPLSLLADALLEADLYNRDKEHARENLLATLSRSHFGLVEAVKQADLGEGTNFLLVVDQFEEIFRFHEAGQWQQEAANEFVSLLLEAAAQKEVPIYIVLTMRSDFIGECGQFEGLAEMVNRGEFLIPRLTREQYKRVIEGPIKVAGGQIEPRLLQRLLNDLGQQADQLPCLQHALMRTWDVWAAKGDTEALDLDDYQRVGKMSQALSLHADEIYESLASDRQRELCQGMFQALTVEEANSRGIRRPQRLGRLCQILAVSADDLLPIINAYRQSGVTFLMPSPEVELIDQTIIDISHESLMRVWTRLRQWVEEETQSAGIYLRLSESADLHERGKAGLYRDPELGIALAWQESQKPNSAWAERYYPGFDAAMAFLSASREAGIAEEQAREAARHHELEQAQQLAEAQQLRLEQQQRSARKMRKLIAGLAVVALVAGLACVAALVANKRANDLREVASQEADRAEKSATEAQKAERETAEALAKVESQKEEVVASLAKAETAGKEAREAAKQARDAEEQGRKLLYATDMQLAPFIWNNPQATAAQLRSRLDVHDPAQNKSVAGKEDLRGFEWYRAKHLLENSATVFRAGPIIDFALADDGQLVTVDQQSRVKHWDPDTHLETTSSNPPSLSRDAETYALSPNGQRVALAIGKKIQVQDAATGVVAYEFESKSRITNLVFSQDGRFLVTYDATDESRLPASEQVPNRAEWFDATSGQAIAACTFDHGRVLWPLSADGLTLAVCGQGPVGNLISILHLDPITKKITPPAEPLDIRGTIGTAALSPDGKLIAVGSYFTGAVIVYDTATRRQIAGNLSAHVSVVSAIAFSRDGLNLATADREGVIKIWGDVRTLTPTSEPQRTLKGHAGAIERLTFSSTGTQLVSAGQDGTVRIWALEQSLSATKRLSASRVDPVFFADGLLIATAEGNHVTIWDAASGQRLRSLAEGGEILSIAISPDNRLLAVGRYAENRTTFPFRPSFLSLWEIDTGRQLAQLAGMESLEQHYAYCALETLVFSPDGKFLVAGFGSRNAHFSGASIDLKVWDVATRRELKRLVGHNGAGVSISFAADGTRLASGSHDGTARIWDTATWQVVGAPLAAGDPRFRNNSVEAVAFSPDGRTLGMGTMGGNLLLWNLATRERVALPKAHANAVTCVTFSPDGRTLASGSADETIRLWNVATLRELMILNSKDLNLGPVRSLSFSPDGNQLLAGAAGAVVWSAAPSVWDNPTSAAKQLVPLLHSDGVFQSRIRTLSEIPRLREALATLNALHPDDDRVQSALAATRANWHAARQQWEAAVKEVDRLLALKSGTPELWLQTPGLLRIADALVRQNMPEKLSELAPTHATINAKLAQQLAEQGLPELAVAARKRARQLLEGQLAKEPQNSTLAAELAELMLIPSPGPNEPNTSAFEKKRFAALKLTDPWAKLAAAYTLTGHNDEAVQYFGKALKLADGYEARKAILAYLVPHDELLTALVKQLPDEPQLQLALARNLAERGKAALTAKEPANTLPQLRQAQDIFTRLLAPVADWTVLTPVEMTANSGVKMELQKDSSVFVPQPTGNRDAYWITFQTELNCIKGLRLEALADFRLPGGGPGWNSDGNFVLNYLGLDMAPATMQNQGRSIALRNASADFSQEGWDVRGAVDDDSGTGWAVSPELNKAHTAVFETAVENWHAMATRLSVSLSNYGGKPLGRLRLSFTNDAATLHATRIRLDLKDSELVDLYVVLAKAYVQNGQSDEAIAVFAQAWSLLKDRAAKSRIIAAAVALATAEQDKDEPPLDDAAKTKLRRQAFDWLKAELTALGNLLETDPPRARPTIVQTLSHWQKDADLAGIRDAGLAKLPADEQKAFTQLWTDVAALLKRAEESPKEQ